MLDLAVQSLPTENAKALCVLALQGNRNGDGWSTPGEINDALVGLRLPPLSNVSTSLRRLAEQGLAMRHEGRWSLTPQGRVEANRHLGDLVDADLRSNPTLGADFAHVRQAELPYGLAPQRWAPGIARLLDRYPFETNVFCMTRFPSDRSDDPVHAVIGHLRRSCAAHGLKLHVASDMQIDDDLLGNVGAYMWACRYGIGLLESRGDAEALNQNVLIELGGMLLLGRRCGILRDPRAPMPPTDLASQIFKTVDFDSESETQAAAHSWLADDLGLGPCEECVR